MIVLNDMPLMFVVNLVMQYVTTARQAGIPEGTIQNNPRAAYLQAQTILAERRAQQVQSMSSVESARMTQDAARAVAQGQASSASRSTMQGQANMQQTSTVYGSQAAYEASRSGGGTLQQQAQTRQVANVQASMLPYQSGRTESRVQQLAYDIQLRTGNQPNLTALRQNVAREQGIQYIPGVGYTNQPRIAAYGGGAPPGTTPYETPQPPLQTKTDYIDLSAFGGGISNTATSTRTRTESNNVRLFNRIREQQSNKPVMVSSTPEEVLGIFGIGRRVNFSTRTVTNVPNNSKNKNESENVANYLGGTSQQTKGSFIAGTYIAFKHGVSVLTGTYKPSASEQQKVINVFKEKFDNTPTGFIKTLGKPYAVEEGRQEFFNLGVKKGLSQIQKGNYVSGTALTLGSGFGEIATNPLTWAAGIGIVKGTGKAVELATKYTPSIAGAIRPSVSSLVVGYGGYSTIKTYSSAGGGYGGAVAATPSAVLTGLGAYGAYKETVPFIGKQNIPIERLAEPQSLAGRYPSRGTASVKTVISEFKTGKYSSYAKQTFFEKQKGVVGYHVSETPIKSGPVLSNVQKQQANIKVKPGETGLFVAPSASLKFTGVSYYGKSESAGLRFSFLPKSPTIQPILMRNVERLPAVVRGQSVSRQISYLETKAKPGTAYISILAEKSKPEKEAVLSSTTYLVETSKGRQFKSRLPSGENVYVRTFRATKNPLVESIKSTKSVIKQERINEFYRRGGSYVTSKEVISIGFSRSVSSRDINNRVLSISRMSSMSRNMPGVSSFRPPSLSVPMPTSYLPPTMSPPRMPPYSPPKNPPYSPPRMPPYNPPYSPPYSPPLSPPINPPRNPPKNPPFTFPAGMGLGERFSKVKARKEKPRPSPSLFGALFGGKSIKQPRSAPFQVGIEARPLIRPSRSGRPWWMQ